MKHPKEILVLLIAISFLLCPSTSTATTLSEVLDGVSAIRNPDYLQSLVFEGEMRLDTSGEGWNVLVDSLDITAAWKSPDGWDTRVIAQGSEINWESGEGTSHPAFDHVFLSRPDLMAVLDRDWMIQYQGTAFWDGEPAWKLLLEHKDIGSDIPSFNLFIRKDDYAILRAVVELPGEIKARTDFTWISIGGIYLPSKMVTSFDAAYGPLKSIESSFYNHDVNGDVSGFSFEKEEGNIYIEEEELLDDGPAMFEELYHGFADDAVVVSINDESGNYNRLSFTFSLYVEDESVIGLLKRRHDAVLDRVIAIIAGWEWTGEEGLGDPVGKYAAGDAIREGISELLGTDAITDFYFLDFDPLRPGEEAGD